MTDNQAKTLVLPRLRLPTTDLIFMQHPHDDCPQKIGRVSWHIADVTSGKVKVPATDAEPGFTFIEDRPVIRFGGSLYRVLGYNSVGYWGGGMPKQHAILGPFP